MYLLKNNKLVKFDTTEDKPHGIKAIKTIEIPSTIIITKQVNDMVTVSTKQYKLKNEIDGYIFRNDNNEQLGGYNITIGDAVKMALNLKYRVYNDDVEITLPE